MNDGIISEGRRLRLLQNLALERKRKKQKQGVARKIVVNL